MRRSSALPLAALSFAALILACDGQSDSIDAGGGGHSADAGHVMGREMPATEPLPGDSIYQLEGSWTDQRGRVAPLAELRGHPVLVLMFYGTCQHACPILVHDLERIEAELGETLRSETRFLLVSFDPERDTPGALGRYADEKGLDPERWRLVHGVAHQIRALSLVLGVSYRPTGDGEFSHSMRITLLDRDGVVAEVLDGLGGPVEPIVETLTQMGSPADSGAPGTGG